LVIRVLVLSLLIFMLGFGAHEVMHLLLIYAVGVDGSIIVRPWRLGYLNFTIYALHAQPAHELDVVRQAVVNFFGPFLAAIPLAALLLYVREPIPFAALAANVVILIFFAIIELADLLLEAVSHVDVPLLTTPEFNYGIPALIIVLTTVTAAILSAVGGRRIPD
jgi:hypothetical protein